MVKDGRMPQPKPINSRIVWDRLKLDLAFDALPDREDGTSALAPAKTEWDSMN
jgi:hypothetical protein